MTGRGQGKWRQAIGWIAAYALALQSTLLGPLGSPLAFADRTGPGAPALVLCLHDHDGTAPSDNPGHRPNGCTRCCDCCLGAPPAIEPTEPSPLALAVIDAREIVWPLADWRNQLAVRYPSQPPRGPPLRA